MTDIHLINPLWNSAGGSEQRTVALYRLLAPHANVTLWSTSRPDPTLAAEYPIRRIRPWLWQFPKRGTLVFVGVYFWLTSWVRLIRPGRCIVIYNTRSEIELETFLFRIAGRYTHRIEMVYASAETRIAAGRPGVVQESPIDLERFRPRPAPVGRPFTVGRLSRDTADKFHPNAGNFLRRLAEDGMQIRVMGGMWLRDQVGQTPGVTLLPALNMPAEDFLAGLDCFYYRTHPTWHETFGRVVFEAMASGVVPVVEARGDYAAYIRHGENGFLFTTEDEAHAQLCLLRDDPERRAAMARAARLMVERMYDESYKARLIAYYTRPTPVAAT